MERNYQVELGDRLRAVRHQQGLTLQQVEENSNGAWKAVVVGSYERGDRAISVAKLARLAAFYGVPVSHLLPPRIEEQTPTADEPRVILDLQQLPDPDAANDAIAAITRFARQIQVLRGDYNGRVLTIRARDLEPVAAAAGADPVLLADELEERGVLRRLTT